MDDADMTSERMEREEEARRRLLPAANEAEATGRCLWCDEPVAPGLRWCPATHPGEGCMTDWEYHQSRRARR